MLLVNMAAGLLRKGLVYRLEPCWCLSATLIWSCAYLKHQAVLPTGAAWLLHSSHQQMRNHQNHSPGCKEGAVNTLTALWCLAAPICSPPRAPEAVLLTATLPVDVKCSGTKLLGNGCSRGGRSARCSQPSSPLPGTLPLQAI